MLDIRVDPPIKTDTRYEFRIAITGKRLNKSEMIYRTRTVLEGYGSLFKNYRRFGFSAYNFKIRHSELWDSVYPLLYITRSGGPLFNSPYSKAKVRFTYPVLEKAVEFFSYRARQFGLLISVEGKTYDRRFHLETSGHQLSFGGGKDSRLLLGVLRELGYNPTASTSWRGFAEDIPGAQISEPLHGALADRIMPGLMSGGQHFYFGGVLSDAHLETPWQMYYDWGAPNALNEFSDFINSLGVDTRCHAPASVLPCNHIQRILFERYPELFKGQNSVRKERAVEKNLHVSLLKLRHGIAFDDHCSLSLFKTLLRKFVEEQTASPEDFGFHRHRMVVNKEMRSIIREFREDERFAQVRDSLSDDWRGDWIDYIHSYANPNINPDILAIFKEYLPEIDSAPPHAAVWRISVKKPEISIT